MDPDPIIARLQRIVWLDPCPDSVWEQLPGGPVAENEPFREVWSYMGSIPEDDGHVRHEFRHRAHPLLDGARVYAHVRDGDAGPHLSRLIADGEELVLPESPAGEEGDALADP